MTTELAGRLLSLSPLFVFVACSSADSGTIQLVTGGETDTFTRSPAPTTLRVDALDPSGNDTVLATATLPATTIDLGTRDANAVATLAVSGLDASGRKLVFGTSLPVVYGGLSGATIPIFVQRTGELARMPGPLSDSRQGPLLSVVQGQYLFVGGGSDGSLAAATQLYDFAQFAPLPSPPSLPRAPESIAFAGTVAWLIDRAGGTYFDFARNAHGDIVLPPGGSFADVAGGATVADGSGALYVVGATRTSGPATAVVLKIDPGDTSNAKYPFGNPSWLALTVPRVRAAATWVAARGLVVAGGSTSGAGVEVIQPGSTSGVALAYPPDPSFGAGASALDTQHVLLAGGVGPAGEDSGARAVDLACASQCAPVAWAALPVPLAFAQAFTLDPAGAFVVGSELASGQTHALRLTTTSAIEVPTKVMHRSARAVWSPVGSIVVFGGASIIESFSP